MQTLVLAATTSKIVGVLSGAITTTNPDFTVHYADDTGSAFTEGEQDGTFNGGTQVDICTAPASSTRRVIKNITVYNRDTVSVTFTLKYSANATLRFITAVTLAAGESWDFSPKTITGATGAAGSSGVRVVCGRLTLTTAVPVTTSDVTGATNVYWTPYKGNQMPLYDGASAWTVLSCAETTLALGTLTSGKPYDVFAYNNSGTMALEALVWTDDTTRATALVYQDGLRVKSGSTTRLYLGTFYTTATTTTEDSAKKRFLFNEYNRERRALINATETADSWNYTTATYRQANSNTANQLDYVSGDAATYVEAEVRSIVASSSSNINASVGIGLSSTTANSANHFGGTNLTTTPGIAGALYKGTPGVGRRFLVWLEISAASGTTTWYGDANLPTLYQSGISGSLLC